MAAFTSIMRIFVFFLVVFLPCVIFAQKNSSKIDSLTALISSTEDTTKINLLNELSKTYQDIAFDSSMKYANMALELSKEEKYIKGESVALSSIGNNYLYNYEYKKAIEVYANSLRLMQKTANQKGAANIYFSIAYAYQMDGMYDKAIENYIAALKIAEEINNAKLQTDLLNNIGSLYFYSQKNYPKALEYFSKMANLAKQNNDETGEAIAFNNIGQISSELKEYEKAKECFNKALELNKKQNNEMDIAINVANIGCIEIEQKEYDLAMQHLIEAADINFRLKQDISYAGNLKNIADIYFKQGKYSLSIEQLKQALQIIINSGYKEGIKDMYEHLAKTYFADKDFENAYINYQKYTAYKDSLLTENVAKQVNEINTKYETEKKDQEIVVLNKDKKWQQLIIYSSTFIIVMVLLLAFFIFRGYKQKQKANLLLEEKNEIIAEKNKDITASINYAKRIQQAILPSEADIQKHIPTCFVLYKPKDIVSGDFYWMEEVENKILLAAVDCTGHGVPGAFMSIVGYNLLNQAVNEHGLVAPSDIMNDMNANLPFVLKQNKELSEVKDGMDMALCMIDKSKSIVQYAGAFNNMYVIRKDKMEVEEILANRFPIGYYVGSFNEKKFTNHIIDVDKEDCIYILSDGYTDQFGGSNGKKFKNSRFKKLLLEIHHLPMQNQKERLLAEFENWKGNLEQVDDVMIIGFKVG